MKSTASVVEIAKAVTSLEVSAHSVVMAALGRIEANNQRLGAFTDVLRDRAINRATSIDAEMQQGKRFPLAGGHIRAIVFHACLQSAAAGAPRRLTMQSVIRAVQREDEKLERAASLEQFGPYAPLVAAEKGMR